MLFEIFYFKFYCFRYLLCKEINILIKILLLSIYYVKGLVLIVMGIGKMFKSCYLILRGF